MKLTGLENKWDVGVKRGKNIRGKAEAEVSRLEHIKFKMPEK